MKYWIPEQIPIFFTVYRSECLSVYQRFRKKFNNDDIDAIAVKKEKYISFKAEISVKLAGVSNKERIEENARKFILRFKLDSAHFTQHED